MAPGECVVAAEAKKNLIRKGVEPSIVITPEAGGFPNYLVRIDQSCSVDCLVNAIVPSLTLAGSEGAIAKFYYYSGTAGQGNHGGTGTLNFDIDSAIFIFTYATNRYF
jgi:hypothetical protein